MNLGHISSNYSSIQLCVIPYFVRQVRVFRLNLDDLSVGWQGWTGGKLKINSYPLGKIRMTEEVKKANVQFCFRFEKHAHDSRYTRNVLATLKSLMPEHGPLIDLTLTGEGWKGAYCLKGKTYDWVERTVIRQAADFDEKRSQGLI